MTNEELCIAYQTGDMLAAEQLYIDNLPFTCSVAYEFAAKYFQLWLDADDFAQEGASALFRAAANYLPGNGVSFLTYAAAVIRNGIYDAIRKVYSQSLSESCQPFNQNNRDSSWEPKKKRMGSFESGCYEKSPEWVEQKKEMALRVQRAVVEFSQREKGWVNLRFGFGGRRAMSLSEAARCYHLSLSRARCLERCVLLRLRGKVGS